MARTSGKVSWFGESASERGVRGFESSRNSFGAYQKSGEKNFDEHFNDLYDHYKESNSIDIKRDLNAMLGDRNFLEQYKEDLMSPVFESYREVSPNDPHVEYVIEQVNNFWDTKVKLYTESASMMGFLPIATLEFPVLLKQFFMSIIKDIIEIESVKTPNIVKHIRSTFMVDNYTGDEYEYPKCLFDGTWERIWEASKGIAIPETVIMFDEGRLFQFDMINFASGTRGLDQLSYQIKIIAVQVDGEVIRLRGNGITLEFSTNGTFTNGDLNFEHNGTQVLDTLGGRVNFRDGTVDIASSSGQVEGVIFSGYLSNEKNLRHVSVRERRDILRFVIEDGPRWNMPFSIEEIDDAAALLDINYYNRMVDEIVRTQEMQECMTVIRFLNEEFEKYAGVATDIYNLESWVQTKYVDLNPPDYFAGDPFKYISTAVQFSLKAMVHQLTESVKLDNLSFIIVGNPMATQLIAEFIQWKVQQGSSIGGITVNNSYGFATDMGASIRVVATNLYDAYTKEAVTSIPAGTNVNPTNLRELILHVYAYPTTPEHISFRHLKYTSHLLTSQSQTAYQSTNAPGGAYNIVTATSRFHSFAVQGIQGRLIMMNSTRVYGAAPPTPRPFDPDGPYPTGAPWRGLPELTAGVPPTP